MATTYRNWGLIGHEWAVDLLARRLDAGRASHAFLIAGPEHIGKMTLALRLAQAFNCRESATPCGACRTCTLIERMGHPDLHLVTPDGRSIKIEQVRELQSDLAPRPMEAAYRVAIIPDIQQASDSAADALLKTLEEPPTSARLIITASAVEAVFPTIVSRCQVLSLRPVAVERIAEALIERVGVDEEQAHLLGWLSGGRPGWAISAATDPAILSARGAMIDRLLSVLGFDRTGRFTFSEEISRSDDLVALLEVWQSWWRDIVLVVSGSQVAPVNADRADELYWLAGTIGLDEARRALEAVTRTLDLLDRNANPRLALDVMLLHLPFVATA